MLKTATVECAVCTLNIVFLFSDFELCTGVELGTFVLGRLTVSWMGWGIYYKCVHICFTVPFSFSALLSHCRPTGGWGCVK